MNCSLSLFLPRICVRANLLCYTETWRGLSVSSRASASPSLPAFAFSATSHRSSRAGLSADLGAKGSLLPTSCSSLCSARKRPLSSLSQLLEANCVSWPQAPFLASHLTSSERSPYTPSPFLLFLEIQLPLLSFIVDSTWIPLGATLMRRSGKFWKEHS